MIIIEDAITSDQISQVRQWVKTHSTKKYVNWIEQDRIIDHRWDLDLKDPSLQFISDLLARYFVDHRPPWSAYQIQTNPHNIHVDEFGKNTWPDTRCWTLIFAFDTIPEFKTIIWQEQFRDGQNLSEWIETTWIPNRTKMPKCDTSEHYDLEHTYDHYNEDYLADYLSLEGVFSYQQGSAVLFDGNKVHCTSNWRKYPQFDHRELLQVHVLSNQPRFSI